MHGWKDGGKDGECECVQSWDVSERRICVCVEGVQCRVRGNSTTASPKARGAQRLWLWYLSAGKAAFGAEEKEQYSVKVSKVPRGSNALGWQSRRAPVPGPCALWGHGLPKRSLASLMNRWQ